MGDKLDVWKTALRHLGEPPVDSVDGNDLPKQRLRDAWRGCARRCLEAGTWNFAEELRQLQRLGEAPVFGWTYYYAKPTGWLRTIYISESGDPNDPLKRYSDSGGRIACSCETVYMSFVHDKYIDLVGPWTQAFSDYVAADLAIDLAPQMISASADKMEELRRIRSNAKSLALSLDAVSQPPQRLGRGRWARAGRGFAGGEQGR